MKIKDLDKATKILVKVKELDSEISQIEKTAELILDKETKSSFSFNIKTEDLTPKSEKLKLDADGSIASEPSVESILRGVSFFSSYGSATEKKEKDNVLTLDFNLTENDTLALLGLMLGIKNRERDALIVQLEKLGIK